VQHVKLLLLCPAPRVGALSDDASDVLSFRRLPVAYIGPKLRTERPRKTKIGTEVAHVTRGSDTTFRVKRSKVNLRGSGAYCGGLAHSLSHCNGDALTLEWIIQCLALVSVCAVVKVSGRWAHPSCCAAASPPRSTHGQPFSCHLPL